MSSRKSRSNRPNHNNRSSHNNKPSHNTKKTRSHSRRSRKSRRGGSRKVILPKPTSGSLGDYSTKRPTASRHRELTKRVSRKGYASTVRELSLRATLNKNRAPVASHTMKEDMEWLHSRYQT